jgi:peptide deformylase
MDAQGQPIDEEVSDLLARVIQHELDHLDGILFITRLNTTERMLAGKTLKKLEKEYRERQRPPR